MRKDGRDERNNIQIVINDCRQYLLRSNGNKK